ncbi:hypothetical protein HN011_007475 [Eciton burchellii]|nr:hypothetical protein HN011_007475 [Eciton burchellii]
MVHIMVNFRARCASQHNRAGSLPYRRKVHPRNFSYRCSRGGISRNASFELPPEVHPGRIVSPAIRAPFTHAVWYLWASSGLSHSILTYLIAYPVTRPDIDLLGDQALPFGASCMEMHPSPLI